ncbi:hypothetical protein [Brachybacterium sp. UNK5269]|uniref:hypothetical protein n=1 Tax=Brachybacterium sp. UNK5269 TaxID=3408576 RepID=UPI003BB0690C
MTAYVARRTAEGESELEIIRCLKRYVNREVYHLIKTNPRSGDMQVDNHWSVNALAELVPSLFKTDPVPDRGPWRTIDDPVAPTVEYQSLDVSYRASPG